MSLAAVNYRFKNHSNYSNALGAAIEKWQNFPASAISHHGAACCQIAREWILAMDHSRLNGGDRLTGPRWIRQKYNWGPTKWSLYWCEAVEKKTLDCGALASLAHEVFTARGVLSFPTQLIQQFNPEATAQWEKKWLDDEASLHWLTDELIYHEGCAVVTDINRVKIWDASAGWWIDPKLTEGYGSLLAVRICAPPRLSNVGLNWGQHRLAPNQWQRLAKIKNARAA
jgi:hypothetical protein